VASQATKRQVPETSEQAGEEVKVGAQVAQRGRRGPRVRAEPQEEPEGRLDQPGEWQLRQGRRGEALRHVQRGVQTVFRRAVDA